MSTNNTAFTVDINPNATGIGEGPVHQSSPAWVLTFLRWKVRDTLRTIPTSITDWSTTEHSPLVVENDCVQLSVSDSKSVLTPSMSATLLVTDVNYETDLAPGDFVFVNILNWESHARAIAIKARNLQAINGPDDGFKGFFKVQSVRKTLVANPETGAVSLAVKITAFAFTEFNNSIYYNPYLLSQSDQNLILYQSLLHSDWLSIQAEKGINKIQDIVKSLVTCFLGSGLTDQGKKAQEISVINANTHFYMPSGVGALLGLSGVKAAKDVYNFLFGVQNYSASNNQSLAQGMNPSGVAPDTTVTVSRIMEIPNQPVEGRIIAKPEYWNGSKVWEILNQFTNSPVNELYTCFRISPNGNIMPTMVFRQIPFTTDGFNAGNYAVTRFMNVPRWNIDPALAFNFDLGRDEVARKNFVQIFGRAVNGPANYDIAAEIAQGNYLYDVDDVKRNGLHPYVVSVDFDSAPTTFVEKWEYRSPGWARIVGDALIGGHLKMSGTIEFVGLIQPIAVGDNLQFDNVVYHIEQISHTCLVTRQNDKVIKSFRTTISVSYGMALSSGVDLEYPEMAFGGAYEKREQDYGSSRILPGVSESQDTVYRPTNPDLPPSKNQSFPQPNTNTAINKSNRDS